MSTNGQHPDNFAEQVEETSKKKTRVVGQQEFTNKQTGEVEQFHVVEKRDVDADFKKIWLGHILDAIDEMGSAKMKVLAWILENMDSRNTIIATIREIEKDIEPSQSTISRTLKILDENDIIRRRTGVIIVSPNVIFRGSRERRLNVLLRYESVDNQGDLFDQPASRNGYHENDQKEPA